MEQTELDILCVNTQTEIGQQAAILVDLINSQDIGVVAYATNLLQLNNLMKAIKDHDVTGDELTDEQQLAAQEKIHLLVMEQRSFFGGTTPIHYMSQFYL